MGRLLVLLLMLLGGCSAKPDAGDYFPLDAGLAWDYRVTLELPQRTTTDTFRVESLGTTRLNDDEAASIRRTSNGTDYYIRRHEDGIFRYAKRTLVEIHPRLDASPRMILPLPVPAKPGKVWTAATTSYTLRRLQPYEEMTGKGSPFNMVYELSGLDETVTVPAGTFEHCLLVIGRAQMRLYSDARRGYSDVEITTQEWYAPGVGLVKLARSEPLDTDVFKGGTLTLELTAFSR